jgi:hypothetical protein
VKLAIMAFGAHAGGHRYKGYQKFWGNVCRLGRALSGSLTKSGV